MDIWRSADRCTGYAAWAPHYPPSAHNALMGVEEAAVLALLPPLAGLTVLDAGCGTGRYIRLLTERGAARVLGIDRSPEMIGRARALTSRVARGDLRALPVADAAVDVVVSGLALPDVSDLRPVVRELARALTAGGTMVCSTLHPRGAQEGWTRTFDTPDGRYQLEAHWHTLEDLHNACSAAGLQINDVREPALHREQGPVALVIRALRLGPDREPRSGQAHRCV